MNTQHHNHLSCARFVSTIFPESSNVNKIFFTILFSLYLALSLIRFNWPAHLLMSFIITWLGLFALMLLSIRIRKRYISIYIFAGFLVTSFLISSLFVSRTERIGHVVLFIVFNTGIAMILLRGYVYSWGGYIVFYGLVGYFLMLMFAGVGPRETLVCSYNGISMMMLIACISLYIILSMENKKIDLKPALITLLISIWGIGRSGIGSSFVLLLGLLFIRLRAKQKYIYIGIITLFITLFIAYLYRDGLFMFAMDHSFFRNAIDLYLARSMEGPDPRIAMWTNYFNNLDIFRVIFGANVLTDPWPQGQLFAYNYHNSFINLHSQTGFMGLIVLALIIFSLFKFYRTNQLFLFLFLTVILRWSTDIGLFFESWDFIPFFFIFYFLKDVHFRVPHSLYPLSAGTMRAGLGKLDSDISGKARSMMNLRRCGI
jgi:hypothetical protein